MNGVFHNQRSLFFIFEESIKLNCLIESNVSTLDGGFFTTSLNPDVMSRVDESKTTIESDNPDDESNTTRIESFLNFLNLKE